MRSRYNWGCNQNRISIASKRQFDYLLAVPVCVTCKWQSIGQYQLTQSDRDMASMFCHLFGRSLRSLLCDMDIFVGLRLGPRFHSLTHSQPLSVSYASSTLIGIITFNSQRSKNIHKCTSNSHLASRINAGKLNWCGGIQHLRWASILAPMPTSKCG